MNNEELIKKVQKKAFELTTEKGFVSMVDLLMKLEYLTSEDYEKWRTKKVDYLERICKVNLKKLSLIGKTLRKYGIDNNLKPSKTVYKSWGKGKKVNLRFSKSGEFKIEEAYATHFVKKKKVEEL